LGKRYIVCEPAMVSCVHTLDTWVILRP